MKKILLLSLSLAVSFIVKSQQVDSIIDIRDNQVYTVVKIGQQWWIQENLDIGIRIDGTQDAADNDIIEKYCYNDDLNNCTIYGGLYQWDETMDYNPPDIGLAGTTRGICPYGWHVPTDNEWDELINLLGDGDRSVAGGKLKEEGFSHWSEPNTGATNESGFTALPGGKRGWDIVYSTINDWGYWWTTREDGETSSFFQFMTTSSSDIGTNPYGDKKNGYSVRCLVDSVFFSYLTITDVNYRSVSQLDFNNENTINELIIINSGTTNTINISSLHTGNAVYEINESAATLLPGDSIHIMMTFNPPGEGKYPDTLFIESDDPYRSLISIPISGTMLLLDSITDIRDKQVYNIVKIGQQWWMQENLNTGTRIDITQAAADNGIIEKYCYDDNTSNCTIYGGLYLWPEMMQYDPSDVGNPGTTRGICPVGWHLPTDDEWTELTDFLGGASVAGGKLKEKGFSHWSEPNIGATNESGFTALPGGYGDKNADYSQLSGYAYFWSSTEYVVNHRAWSRVLFHHQSFVQSNYDLEDYMYSVRCVKDTFQFWYLTITDENFKWIPGLNFYGDNSQKVLIIINSGSGKTITVSSVYTTNPVFTLNKSSMSLPPGDSIHLTITFNPPDQNVYPDTLFIISDDPVDSLITIPLNGTFPAEISFTDSTGISCYGYSDGSVTVSPSLGTPPYQYQWDDPANTTDSVVTGLSAGVYYHVTVTDSNEWMVSDSVMLSEPDSLIIQSDHSDIICMGSSEGFISVDPSGGTPPYQYAWLDGGDSQNLTELPAGNYSVTVTDTNGCHSTQNYLISSIAPYEEENICIVTIDSLTGRNLVVWEKTPGVGISSYNIYREGNLIGTPGYNALSVFLDTVADPGKRPYLYRISVVDTCGNESGLSAYHKPLFLQFVSSVDGVNLTWSKYEIEGNVLSFDSYTIYRGGDSTSLSPLETNIPKEVDVYTDNDPDALSRKYFYRVAGVLPDPCTPTETIGKKADSGPYSHAISNVEDNRLKVVDGLHENHVKNLSVLPNPFTERTSLIFDNPDGFPYTLYIIDLSGKVCRVVDSITASGYILERDGLKEGFYLIELRGPEVLRGKMIVE